MKHPVFLILSLNVLLTIPVYSQEESMDFMRSTGKIYVVVAVLAVIFLVLIFYLIYIDLKVRRLESKISDGKKD